MEYASVIVSTLMMKSQGMKGREEEKGKKRMPSSVTESTAVHIHSGGLSSSCSCSEITHEFIPVIAVPLSLLSI